MNDTRDRLEDLLAGLRPPDPPSGLEARVLALARDALAREAGRDTWTRIWESRPVRLVWAAAVLVLVICNVGVSALRSGPAASVRPTPGPGRDGRGEATAIERLPRLDERARPLIGAQAYRLIEEQEAQHALHANGKGKESSS